MKAAIRQKCLKIFRNGNGPVKKGFRPMCKKHSKLKHEAIRWLASATLTLLCTTAWADLPTASGWYSVPNTKLKSVCATSQGFSEVAGVQNCPAILNWSGAVYDTKRHRLVVWGGGHNDYYGNELYAFNLQNLTMVRLNDPGLPIATSCSESIVSGTQPNSRHTYDGIEYLPESGSTSDRMFVFGGAPACGPGAVTKDTWTFDFTAMRWQRMSPKGPIPKATPGVVTGYDSNTGLVFLHDTYDLYSYRYTTDTFTRLTNGADPYLGYHSTGTVDTKRRRFYIVGYNTSIDAGQVHYYDIGPSSTYRLQTVSTTGGASVINSSYPGLEYDPVTDRVIAWNGGDTVYALDPSTHVWSSFTYTGGPGPANPWSNTGTLGRWRYAPFYNVFVVVNDVNQDVYTMRISGPGAPPPPPDTTPPAVPVGISVE